MNERAAPLLPRLPCCGLRHFYGDPCPPVRLLPAGASRTDGNALYASMIDAARRGAERNNALRAERKAARARRAGRNSADTRWGRERKRKRQ